MEEEHDCDYIGDGIFLENFFASHNRNLIGQTIFHLISLRNTTDVPSTPPNLNCFCLPIHDDRSADIVFRCEQAYDYIERIQRHPNGQNVLVYCEAGKSRSASVVIYYFMKKHRMPFQKAYEFVRSQRPCIEPNLGFIKQLKQLTFD
jgi:dual specificity phosphatase 12